MSEQILSQKRCTGCHKIKPLSEFHKDRSKKDGVLCQCKICTSVSDLKRKHTKNGLVVQIYGTQRGNSRKRGHVAPNYTLQELKLWIFAQPSFGEIYKAWVGSDYNKMLVPSCDRLDDYLPYSLDNLRLTTWQQNFDKGHADIKGGINNKQSKAVLQLTKDGDFITDHHSVNQASRVTGIDNSNLSSCCRGERSSAGGFKWVYYE